MDNCYINLGAVKAKEIDGELYVSCWNFSKALAEKEREISDLCKENDEQKKQISKLESELECSREYTESLRRMLGLRSAKENIELANKLYGLNFEMPDDEEPLPFSSDEYEEDFPEELRSKDLNFNLVSKMLDVIELMLTDTQS